MDVGANHGGVFFFNGRILKSEASAIAQVTLVDRVLLIYLASELDGEC